MLLGKCISESFIEALKYKKYCEAEQMILDALHKLNLDNQIYSYIIEKNDKMYITYQFTEIGDGSINKVLIDTTIDSLIPHMEKTISRIDIGSKAVNKLNNLLRDSRIAKDGYISVQYKWGTNKYSTVSDWDYGNIKIKLSDMALDYLISAYKLDEELTELRDIISKFDWDSNIIEFIKAFNDFELHRRLSVTIKDYDITKLLTDNMFNTADILDMIKNNSTSKKGIQKFKSVFVVNELGSFIAIIDWVVDYSKKDIAVNIQDEKVIDVENTRFVSDHSIYSRIELRALISDDVKNSLFGSEALVNTLEI